MTNIEMIRSASLGIELGSTRIKATLIGADFGVLASGSHAWENKLENGVWTYALEDAVAGVQDCYADLLKDIKAKYDVVPDSFASIGISAMMHGYIALDKSFNLLVPFRTWRNTMTAQAAAELSELFKFNIPQRWSIAHLRQAMLNNEPHVADISFISTLAVYIHYLLTGEKVIGVGEASGMFPIDPATNDYDAAMVEKFNGLVNFGWKLPDILPKVLVAGEAAGCLTEEGAKLLDPTGALKAGVPFCPPEGDAGTGMVATNSVGERTGNVSAGTSVFGMVVMEKPMKSYYPEIDVVATPAGKPVAMAHCNNCTSDLNAWVGLFGEFAKLIGADISADTLYGSLYRKALEGAKDCGGLLAYNYSSGEHVTHFDEGRPLFERTPDAAFNLANFMRTNLYASLSVLKLGFDILMNREAIRIDRIFGHGGLFRTKGVGQSILAAAINAPVSVMETAGEGGPWGMALLAAYMVRRDEGESLEAFLNNKVFASMKCETMQPDPADVEGFSKYIERYSKGLAIERAAVENS